MHVCIFINAITAESCLSRKRAIAAYFVHMGPKSVLQNNILEKNKEIKMKIKKLSAIIIAISLIALMSAYILPEAYTKEANKEVTIKLLSDTTINDISKVTYTCPMHPEVTSDKPGTCPKCGMDLVLQKKDEKDRGMNNCPDMKQCKKIGCNMNDCKGHSGGCMSDCPMMKDHNSNDNDDNSGGHKHKSGCKKGC